MQAPPYAPPPPPGGFAELSWCPGAQAAATQRSKQWQAFCAQQEAAQPGRAATVLAEPLRPRKTTPRESSSSSSAEEEDTCDHDCWLCIAYCVNQEWYDAQKIEPSKCCLKAGHRWWGGRSSVRHVCRRCRCSTFNSAIEFYWPWGDPANPTNDTAQGPAQEPEQVSNPSTDDTAQGPAQEPAQEPAEQVPWVPDAESPDDGEAEPRYIAYD